MVIFINSKVLKPDQSKISEANIDRCHQVGPKSKPKQILIKFSSYHTIWHVFRSKGNLNNYRDHVFVCEDLTTDNYKLVKSLNGPPPPQKKRRESTVSGQLMETFSQKCKRTVRSSKLNLMKTLKQN